MNFLFSRFQIGSVTGFALAISLLLGFGAVSSLFSVDSEVLEIARSGTFVSKKDHTPNFSSNEYFLSEK